MAAKKSRESAKKPKELKLDLACGSNKAEGYVGVDRVKTADVDIVHDLEKYPWPFESDSVDEANISHYVEHTQDLFAFMNELHRILKPGGRATITSPYYSSMRAWQDPTHTRAISEATFLYFNQDWLKQNKLDHYDVTADFDFSYGYVFYPEWASRSEEARAFAIKHYNNVVSDIQVVLLKREADEKSS